jgi:hypothetical protein
MGCWGQKLIQLTIQVCEDKSVHRVEEENIAHQSCNTNPVPIILWENSIVYQDLLPKSPSAVGKWLSLPPKKKNKHPFSFRNSMSYTNLKQHNKRDQQVEN